MRRRVALMALVTALLLVVTALPGSALSEDAAWGIVPSPNNSTHENELAGLAVVAPDDIWAVGRYNTGRPPTVTGRDTLALHWDGLAWTVVPTPNPTWAGADYFTLEDAVATSATDVWAVGSAQDFASLKSTTLVERWDGSAWSIVPSPNPGGANLPNRLNAITVVAPNDLVAVGTIGFPARPLVMRWNGTRWHPVRNPCRVELNGVDARSATDIWAVGSATTCHFDGTRWRVVPSPKPRSQFGEIAYILTDVSGNAADDVWVSGYRVIEEGEHLDYASIVEHWNGSSWTLNTSVAGQSLNGVEALAPGDVWAVGTDGIRGIVLHFDGSAWNLVPSPTPGDSGSLADVEAESVDHLWAAGTSLGKTLVLESPSRFDGTVTGDTHVAGATVSWFGPETGSVQTDVGGGFAAAGLAAGSYQFIATYAGCTPGQAQVQVVAGQTIVQDITITC